MNVPPLRYFLIVGGLAGVLVGLMTTPYNDPQLHKEAPSMTVTPEQKEKALRALVDGGFTRAEARELLADPKGLRDEFAAAVVGPMAAADPHSRRVFPQELTREAYIVADAMMAERAK